MGIAVGERFRGLLVQSELGRGAMGAAYLASHPVLRTPFVIKIAHATPDFEPFREAHLAARVSSPYVVGVIDAGMEEGVPFVVQRYVDGIDLAELANLRRAAGARLPVEVVCRIAGQVARGLHAIHQTGVVHCDIKPENLFFRGSGHTLVGDLGVAVDPSRRIAPGEVGGTPLFVSPERWRGAPPDRRSDIYALGATLHAVATGDHFFDAVDVAGVREAHLSRPYAPPTAVDPRDAYLFAVIERMLRKAPEERHANAERVARELDVVTTERPHFQLLAPGQARLGDLAIQLVRGDLSKHPADVLVSAANWRMTMEVGVAAALLAAGGATIAAEAVRHAPAAMGDVVWTGAGTLPAKHVAHAVAALAGAVCIQRATMRVLLDADLRRAGHVAFPALGAGVGGVPMELVAKLMLEATRTFAELHPAHVRQVSFVLSDEGAFERWDDALSLA